MKLLLKVLLWIFLIFVLVFNPLTAKILTHSYAVKYDLNKSFFMRQISQESSFNAFAYSKSGAKGLGQIMPSTASYYSDKHRLLIWLPFVNLDIAAQHQKNLLSKYNKNYSLSLAAYNWGEGNLNKLLKKNKIKKEKIDPDKNYSYLFKDNKETYNYINKILK